MVRKWMEKPEEVWRRIVALATVPHGIEIVKSLLKKPEQSEIELEFSHPSIYELERLKILNGHYKANEKRFLKGKELFPVVRAYSVNKDVLEEMIRLVEQIGKIERLKRLV